MTFLLFVCVCATKDLFSAFHDSNVFGYWVNLYLFVHSLLKYNDCIWLWTNLIGWYICLQGKEWVDEVRKCLMRKLALWYAVGFDCDTIKRKAFASHVRCYLESGVGFCLVALTNLPALYNVYEPKDFFGKDALAAWMQVRVFYNSSGYIYRVLLIY